MDLDRKTHTRGKNMVEDYLRTRLRFLLDGLIRCPRQGDEDTVGLGWVESPPVDNKDLAAALCKAMGHPNTVRTIYHEYPGDNPHRFTSTQWDVGPWVCFGRDNRVVVRAERTPSAHAVLTAMAVRDKLKTMDVSGLVGPGCGSL